jgi:hypothetical protein
LVNQQRCSGGYGDIAWNYGRRIRFSRLLIHLVGDFADDIEKEGKSSSRCSYGVVDLVSSTCVAGFVPRYTDLLKSSAATT